MNHQNVVNPISVSVDDAARMIGVARTALYELIARGELVSFKFGRRRLILVSELESFITMHAAREAR